MGIVATARSVVSYVWNHPSNRGHRIAGLGRAMAFQLRGRVLRRRTLARLGDRSLLWAELHRTASSRVVYGNPPDWAEMLTWKRLIEPGDVFIDVGANVGAYSVYLAELGASVEAIEPHPEAVVRLRENVALNGSDVRVHAAAAADQKGRLRITPDRDDLNHVVAGGGLEVDAITIDDLLAGGAARGVKIDVEGFERVVLAGATAAMAEARIDVFQLEWNSGSQEVLSETRGPAADLLRSHGYRLMRPDAQGELVDLVDDSYGEDIFAFTPGVAVPEGRLD